MIIAPPRSRYYARLSVTDEGVRVEIWRYGQRGGAALVERDLVQAPLHQVRDLVHDLIKDRRRGGGGGGGAELRAEPSP